MYYFGVLSDPKAARTKYLHFLNRLNQEKAAAPIQRESVTLNYLVNDFLTQRNALVESGERSAAQFARYRVAAERVIKALGRTTTIASLAPRDFARLRQTLRGNATTIGNAIRDIRTIFRWGEKQYGVKAIFGDAFDKPSKRAVQKDKRPRVLWTPPEIHALLSRASPAMRCFILMGINCAYGQGDCAAITRSAFDLTHHWMPRGKTLIDRRCPLWPTTVAALCDYQRPTPRPQYADLFFVTRLGLPWVNETRRLDAEGAIEHTYYKDNVNQELKRLCAKAGVVYRPFYNFRHTFRSVADEVADTTAINTIMGHSHGGMKEVYTQLMGGGMRRLKAVTEHVHNWLFS
jgi:integrase